MIEVLFRYLYQCLIKEKILKNIFLVVYIDILWENFTKNIKIFNPKKSVFSILPKNGQEAPGFAIIISIYNMYCVLNSFHNLGPLVRFWVIEHFTLHGLNNFVLVNFKFSPVRGGRSHFRAQSHLCNVFKLFEADLSLLLHYLPPANRYAVICRRWRDF